jgi:uncharacterized protein
MKYSRGVFLLAMVPVCALAATSWGHQWQPQECLDARLYFKLLLWGPVVEELVFRAGLQKWLIRQTVSPHLANGITSSVFALMHYALSANPTSLAVFFPSIALGWIYQKTNSLAWAIGLHVFFNLLFLILMC